MLTTQRIPALRNQALIGLSIFVFGFIAAYEAGGKIITGDNNSLIFGAVAVAGCVTAVAILRSWRLGTFLLLGWLTFEDLFRKYMGNGLALFFGKDILAGLVYISLYIAVRKKKEKLFKPPFMLFLSLFFWLGVLQMFNQNSPSVWYGLLGFKVYFYYIPFMFVGYAFARSDEDLRKFLVWNAILGGLVAAVGLAQSVIGNSFLNPPVLAPELQLLGDLQKSTPLTNQLFNLPDSVFVSSGRYGSYLTIASILTIGAAGYLLLTTKRSRAIVFVVTGMLSAAALLSGSRGCFLSVVGSAAVLCAGFLWGAPWRQKQGHRMLKAIRWSVAFVAVGLFAMFLIFPEQTGSRVEYYSESLLPSSSAYELTNRSWDYPVEQLMNVFNEPNWVVGNGIGTASLGMQYVQRLTGKPAPNLWVEEGYGDLIVEMGILAPMLWILWSAALVYCSWKIVRQLRETRYFPLALAILWYAFLLLFPLTFGSLASYQNYTCNAYLWLLIGVLFRLPELQANAVAAPVAVPERRRARPGGFQF